MKELKQRLRDEIKMVKQSIIQPSLSLSLSQMQETAPEFAEEYSIPYLINAIHQIEENIEKKKT